MQSPAVRQSAATPLPVCAVLWSVAVSSFLWYLLALVAVRLVF
jgi:hypothetical protein